jgi:hypothetical protein
MSRIPPVIERCAISLLLLATFSHPARSQTKVIDLGSANAVAPQEFSLLRGARELGDGRLVITDWLEQRLSVIDFERRTVEDRGRLGAGPEEFRLPGAILPFRGDSLLLVDVGNGRLAVLDGNAQIRRSFVPAHPAATSPGGADARGNLYFTIPPWLADPPLADDSVSLSRIEAATRQITPVVLVRGNAMLTTPAPQPRVPFVIFAPQDSWRVTQSGRIVIARGGDYSIESIESDGVHRRGPSHAGRARPVTMAERRSYVRRFLAGSPIGGRGSEGLTLAPAEQMSDPFVDGVVQASTFGETLPHFAAGELWLDAFERLWVGRTVADRERRLYDIFDRGGNRITTVRLGMDRHLLTVGQSHVYVVITDQDGLQTIERVPLPAALTEG